VDQAAPTVAQHAADAAGALGPHTAELSADIYALIVREIPQLHTDGRVLILLEASVTENVATVLHILQHGIDLDHVHAPAAAEQYARRLAQRGIPMAALLRAYRIGSTRFQHWCLQELAAQTDDAAILSAAGLRIAETTAAYIDQVSEELVAAYEAEKENWLRNLGAARAARVRTLLEGDGATSTPPRPSWATAFASTTSGWCAGSTIPTQAAVRWCDWNRRPPSWPAKQRVRGGRCLFPRMSPAPGPGSRSATGRSSPFRPCAALLAQDRGSGSPSALLAPACPGSVVPTGRH
jgi:hypothetical protein